MRRRDFLRAASASALVAALPEELLAQNTSRTPGAASWDPGVVRHLLPTVNDTQILLKASFETPFSSEAPILRVAGRAVPGRRSDAVLGSANEAILKRAAGPQIVPVYGTDFRSTPVFFIQDDHDYFDKTTPTTRS